MTRDQVIKKALYLAVCWEKIVLDSLQGCAHPNDVRRAAEAKDNIRAFENLDAKLRKRKKS